MDRPTLKDCIDYISGLPCEDGVVPRCVTTTIAHLLRLRALEEALKAHDAYVAACPVLKAKGLIPVCPACGATAGQRCGKDAVASYRMIATIRATLKETQPCTPD